MTSSSASPRNRRIVRNIAIVVALCVVGCIVAFFVYTSDYYHADETRLYNIADTPIEETGSEYAIGNPDSEYGLVLYPGAKVDPAAYIPLAADLASQDIYCIIAKMPFNLAFFGIDSASQLMDEAPAVSHWWVGGHSLGGVAAAQFAESHTDALEGIVLLASYTTADLSHTSLKGLSITGSNDGIINREAQAENASNLPANTESVAIEGGNHAGFGAYGSQSGDGIAAISAEDQQGQTARTIARAMEK